MRRFPAALNPNVSAGIRADEHAASPSRMHAASSGGRPHAAGMRRSGAASRWARRVRLPLRGQHRLARLRRSHAPCFPFNCARRRSAREHQNACECRRRCGERQGETGRRRAFGMAAAAPARPHPAPARRVRADRSLCYRSAAFGARTRISAHAVKRETGGRMSARPVLSPQRYAARAPRLPRTRPGRPRCHCPSAGGKAAAWQAASPDTGRRKGRARCSPNARSAGDGWGAHSARARAGFARSIMSCLSVGSRCAARFPLSTASTRCAPCRPR